MLFDWLAQHQQILTWLGGGLATVAGGAWIVVRYFLERSSNRSSSGRSDAWRTAPAAPSQVDAPEQTSGTIVSAGTGIATGGPMQVRGDVIIQQGRIPRAAIVLAVFGLLLLAFAAFNSGSHIDVRNGSYVGGNVSNSTISVTPSK